MIAVLKSIDLYSFHNDPVKKSQGADLWSYAPPSFLEFDAILAKKNYLHEAVQTRSDFQ